MMKASVYPDRFPWWRVGGGATLVVLGAAALLRLPPPPQVSLPRPARPLQLSHLDQTNEEVTLGEELALQDPIPLFLPTPWNSGQADLSPAMRPVPTVRFGSFPAKLQFGDGLDVPLTQPTTAPTDAVEAAQWLLQTPSLHGMSERAQEASPPLPPRLFHLEVLDLAAGQVWARLEGRVERTPDATAPNPLREQFWAPLEAMVAVDAAGVIGRPSLTQSSGAEAVDAWVLDFLRRQVDLGVRLPPGFYRVVVGP